MLWDGKYSSTLNYFAKRNVVKYLCGCEWEKKKQLPSVGNMCNMNGDVRDNISVCEIIV